MDLYPACRYHPDGRIVIVDSISADAALGEGWYDSPAKFPKSDQIILALAERTVSGESIVALPLGRPVLSSFYLDVAASAAPTDTLRVFIQHSPDGVEWDDFVSFPIIVGNKYLVASWTSEVPPTDPVHPLADGVLSPGTVMQGPVNEKWRIKWLIDGATARFTFSVRMKGVFNA